MRIGLQTWGSEGDVRPFLALAAGLAAAGHDVTLVVTDLNHADYSGYARTLGFSLRAVNDPLSPSGAQLDDVGRQLFASASPLRQLQTLMRALFEPTRPTLYEASRALCAGSDIVVGHLILDPLRAAAQRGGVPWVTLAPAPMGIPSAIERPFGTPDFGRWATPALWRLARAVLNRSFLPGVNAFRARHGLAPDDDVLTQTWTSSRRNLLACSPVLLEPRVEWAEPHRVCGFLNLPDTSLLEAMAPGLEEFLSGGAPPVYFTFGSMMPANLDYIRDVAAIWSSAVARVGCRAIFQLPWHDPADVPTGAQVFLVQRAPHRRIFPRCALVVHHGGAGTSQAALLAGRPAIVVAHVIDQFYWAAQLSRLGAGGEPLRRKGLTAAALAAAIARLLRAPRAARVAHALGQLMAQEDGVQCAVRAIEGARTGP
jgi:sterol 3beta-glucosyltransferase/vancomycin aglycone glucosyltransferase